MNNKCIDNCRDCDKDIACDNRDLTVAIEKKSRKNQEIYFEIKCPFCGEIEKIDRTYYEYEFLLSGQDIQNRCCNYRCCNCNFIYTVQKTIKNKRNHIKTHKGYMIKYSFENEIFYVDSMEKFKSKVYVDCLDYIDKITKDIEKPQRKLHKDSENRNLHKHIRVNQREFDLWVERDFTKTIHRILQNKEILINVETILNKI